MGRRGKTSAADVIMDLMAMLPWWVGVALAVAGYLVLNSLAARPAQLAAIGSPPSGVVTLAAIKGLASAGQYVVPILCLAGAGLSAFRRHHRRQLMTSASKAPDAIDGMHWHEFEVLVGEAFRRQGYQVVESGGGGADGGVDLVLSRASQDGTEKTLVQCKHWRAYKVGVDVIRELYGVMAARGAAAGIVVTSGQFTAEAEAFAQGRNLRLVDGPALDGMIRSALAQPRHRPAPSVRAASEHGVESAASGSVPSSGTPACPDCGRAMVQRTAKRGAKAGRQFWGCPGYPACRGTRSMEPR